MRIAFYAPLKPLDHPHPSGDLVIGTGLYHFLEGRGHQIGRISRLRARWIYWKPWLWPQVVRNRNRSLDHCRKMAADLWLTYHSYYKAPDLLGPYCCRRLGLPYVIFQGYLLNQAAEALDYLGWICLESASTSELRTTFLPTGKKIWSIWQE